MKEKIGLSIIFLVAMLALLPSLFAEGGYFATGGYELDLTGKFVWVKDVYFDNVYFTIVKFLVAYIGFVIPYLLPTIKRIPSIISFMFGAWFFAAFLHELWNFKIPDLVLNSNDDRTMFTQYLVSFILGVTAIMIRETWNKAKK